MPIQEEQKDPELSKTVKLIKGVAIGVPLGNLPPDDKQHSIEPLYTPK